MTNKLRKILEYYFYDSPAAIIKAEKEIIKLMRKEFEKYIVDKAKGKGYFK